MRVPIILLHVALTLLTTASGAEPEKLRVLTYNIHHGEGVDGELDLNRIAKVIRTESPDLVALQEVDQGTRRTNRIDEPNELSRMTHMQVVFQKNIDYEGGGYGNVVLSKLPVKSHTDVKLPSLKNPEPVEQREQRGALVVEVQTTSGTSVLFASTHLDCRRQDTERFESAKVINDWFQRNAVGRPALLAGDMNATCDSRVLTKFDESWTRERTEEMPTVPAKTPRRQIDYILHRPADRWRTVEVRVLDEAVASDHRAYFAILELMPQQRK